MLPPFSRIWICRARISDIYQLYGLCRRGRFRAYHRLYDVVGVTVISDKNTVGFYDMNSVTTVERAEA